MIESQLPQIMSHSHKHSYTPGQAGVSFSSIQSQKSVDRLIQTSYLHLFVLPKGYFPTLLCFPLDICVRLASVQLCLLACYLSYVFRLFCFIRPLCFKAIRVFSQCVGAFLTLTVTARAPVEPSL